MYSSQDKCKNFNKGLFWTVKLLFHLFLTCVWFNLSNITPFNCILVTHLFSFSQKVSRRAFNIKPNHQNKKKRGGKKKNITWSEWPEVYDKINYIVGYILYYVVRVSPTSKRLFTTDRLWRRIKNIYMYCTVNKVVNNKLFYLSIVVL